MSEVISKSEPSPDAELNLAIEPRGWVDQKLSAFSEYISPILVKETRQSLKSRQFFWTFFLLLTATAVWSALGFSIGASEYEYPGRFLLSGYWSILAVPLIVIIPFAVFRSLASEFENNTLQLVSITTMKPYQIIIGKLGSAMLQMMVYFSVLAPCICFTYLLRGVDLAQVTFGLGISFFSSLGLSMIGLFLAGVTRNNVFRMGLSVVFILGLFAAFMGFNGMMSMVADGYGPEPEFLPALMLGLCSTFFALGFLAFTAASSQVSFPADNRSTWNRIAMLIANVVLISLLALTIVDYVDKSILWLNHIVICHLWLIFGILMVGESPFMSPRVRRSLPTSFASRSLLSFLWPGPGRGYLLAMVNLFGWTVVLSFVFWQTSASVNFFGGRGWSISDKFDLQIGLLINFMFASLILSATYGLVHFLQTKRVFTSPGGSFLIGILIFGFCLVLSLTLHYSLVLPGRASFYSGWQLLNWYWTGFHWIEYGQVGSNKTGLLLLAFITSIMILACIAISSRELLRSKTATPQRVLQDSREQSPSYVEPSESIDNIFEQRQKERDGQ